MTAQCPTSPPKDNSNWKPYVGDPSVFHCGYDGYLENRTPAVDNPVGECFYDEKGQLVDENHPYSLCGGTPDQYPASDWWNHTVNDGGGIFSEGWNGYSESQRRKIDAFEKDTGCIVTPTGVICP